MVKKYLWVDIQARKIGGFFGGEGRVAVNFCGFVGKIMQFFADPD